MRSSALSMASVQNPRSPPRSTTMSSRRSKEGDHRDASLPAATAVPRVHVETRAQWRQWLTDHHQHARSVWVVSWRKHTGRPAVSYDDAVTEALAFGWVDSKPAALDNDRTMLYYSPRKAGSGWSRPNKLRIQTLERDGLMTPAGRRVIDAAKADGSWTMLDDAEDLVVPDDLASALDTGAGGKAPLGRLPAIGSPRHPRMDRAGPPTADPRHQSR